MIASGHDGKPDKQKVALLLHVARKQAIDVFNTFALTDEQKADYGVVIHRFETYCSPKTKKHMSVICSIAANNFKAKRSSSLSPTSKFGHKAATLASCETA